MRIGVPTEIKIHEYRVGLVPAAVRELGAVRPRGAGADRRRRTASAAATRTTASAGAQIAPDADGGVHASRS